MKEWGTVRWNRQIAPLRSVSPRLRRDGADRVLPHGRAGSPGARRDPVRQRPIDHPSQARALLRPGAAADPGRGRPDPRLHADARQGAPHGVPVRHPAFPHRSVPFPDLQRTFASTVNDAAWPSGPPGPEAAVCSFPGLPLVSISNAQRAPVPDASFVATHPHWAACRRPSPSRASRVAAVWRFWRISTRRNVSTARSPSRGPSACRSRSPRRGGPRRRGVFPLRDRAAVGAAPASSTSRRDRRRRKPGFLGEARALLFPIEWPEPFSLVMVEAMARGTPVLAFRRGSVPEVIDDWRDRLGGRQLEEANCRLARVLALDRARVRRRFEDQLYGCPHGERLRCCLRASDRPARRAARAPQYGADQAGRGARDCGEAGRPRKEGDCPDTQDRPITERSASTGTRASRAFGSGWAGPGDPGRPRFRKLSSRATLRAKA